MFLSQEMRLKSWKIGFYVMSFVTLTLLIFSVVQPQNNINAYNNRWTPALTLACKGKMGALNLSKVPPAAAAAVTDKITAFLATPPTVKTFDCAQIPAEATVDGMEAYDNHLRFFYRFQTGFYAVVGTIWGLLGPNWNAAGVVTSAFAAGVGLGLFALARLFAPLPAAAIIAATAFSTMTHAIMIHFIRDYAKTFFTISIMLFLIFMIMKKWNSIIYYRLYIFLLGCYSGIGIGFRQDIIAYIIMSSIIIFLMPPSVEAKSPISSNKVDPLSAFALVTGFLLLALPYYRFVPVEHTHEGHFFILGLWNHAFENAGWSTRDLLFGPTYDDYSAYALIAGYTSAVTNTPKVLVFSELYDLRPLSPPV